LTKQDNRSVYKQDDPPVLRKAVSQTEFAAAPVHAPAQPTSRAPRHETASPVVELRQYTLHPGARDTLIGLFDKYFLEPQEDAGMTVIGQFCNIDLPDLFVWLRGFPDIESRKASLGEFYGGPVWAAHRNAANATMIDSDDVLLLRPAWESAGFDMTGAKRPSLVMESAEAPPLGALHTATIWHLTAEAEGDFISSFRQMVVPLLASLGAPVIAAFVTEHAENTFPRLPVRASENVFVTFARFTDMAAQEAHRKALAGSPEWRTFLAQAQNQLSKPTEFLRLTPTVRSRLR
jgi:hypothetical protein